MLLPSTKIVAAPEFLAVAHWLQSALRSATAWDFAIVSRISAGTAVSDPYLHRAICLSVEPGISNSEGYHLHVSWMAIRIRAAHPAGAFYAVQTLLQLLPPAVRQAVPRLDVDWSLPCFAMEDEPRFRWRGAMLDSGRYFQPVAFIKKFLSLMALHKLNVFHWHLTEDQGWRIEIKKYPRLTAVGSHRSESPRGHHQWKAGGDGISHSGFYTQQEIREIVDYAAEHFITIVPEVEMPGHAQAAIAAYPELGCTGQNPGVSTSWGVHENIFNPMEATLRFLQDVLDEVLGLFPGAFIHVGGDEAVKTQWKNNPDVAARMGELGIGDVHSLQSYFISQMADFLSRRGRRLIGWDEIVESGLPRDAAMMSWRGMAGGIAAANAGHDVVMAPKESTYLDFYQSLDTSTEPLAWGGYLPLEAVYAFDPIPAEISPENVARILGIQGQIWTEYIATTDQVEYMAFPRLCALAEVAWSPPANRSFTCFKRRLLPFLKHLDILSVRYRSPNPCNPG